MLFNRYKKVIVGMSGGVDSSVSAWLLQQQGYHVEGVFMKNWEEDDSNVFCSSAKDLLDAQDVCDQLGIVLNTINFSSEYWDNVFTVFLSELKRGNTPNPDILCNKEIKFKVFLEFAIQDLEADFIATGHYARCLTIDQQSYLLRGVDNNKDQSYFLYILNYNQLKYCLFPLGIFTKSKVRNIARELNLSVATKKDSTGICFIGKRNFTKFISSFLPIQPGLIVTSEGEIIGSHQGLMYYTLGQRKGLRIGGISTGNGQPWYVSKKDLITNNLIVSQGIKHPDLMSCGLVARDVCWINRNFVNMSFRCTAKIRYQQLDFRCLVKPLLCEQQVQVYFEHRINSVTPGQSIVFYLGEFCIGGGIISLCYL